MWRRMIAMVSGCVVLQRVINHSGIEMHGTAFDLL